jgi:DNA polymerase (family 10)
MTNQEIADIFKRIAMLLEIKGENRFKIRAYQRTAEYIPTLTVDLAALSEKELTEIPSIGSAIAGKIKEFSSTGRLAFLEKLEAEIPPSLIDLLAVQDVGPKKPLFSGKN